MCVYMAVLKHGLIIDRVPKDTTTMYKNDTTIPL